MTCIFIWTLNQVWIKNIWKKISKNRELRPWTDQIAWDLSNIKIINKMNSATYEILIMSILYHVEVVN